MTDLMLRPQLQDAAGMDADFSPILKSVGTTYPALAPHLDKFRVQWGTPPEGGEDRQLEYYHPWESENPNPGKATIELYRKDMSGTALEKAVAGDALHYLGAVDPSTNEPIDPRFHDLKQSLAKTITPEQAKIDQQVYQEEGDTRPFGDWMDQSRLDAYIRGHVTPDESDEWRNYYTPDQTKILQQTDSYLRGRSK